MENARMQIHANLKYIKIQKNTNSKNMFPSSDFYQNLYIYTKFNAYSEFEIKKIKFEKKNKLFFKNIKIAFLS